jgi:ABC-2 type transport system permease protein
MLIGMLVGFAVRLPQTSGDVILQGVLTIAGVTLLTITLGPPIAFIASAGRGYLAPMGAAILAVLLAQVIAAIGWGHFFPWSVPALYAGMAGPELARMGSVSYVLVYLTGLGGMAATFYYWRHADQTY